VTWQSTALASLPPVPLTHSPRTVGPAAVEEDTATMDSALHSRNTAGDFGGQVKNTSEK